MTPKENISLVTRYVSMLRRCENPKDKNYKRYGGRGVRVCEEWRNDVRKFIDWSVSNGFSMELELDKDIKGDGLLYGPDTCTWATRVDNRNNTRRSEKYLFEGELLTVSQISKKTKIQSSTIKYRLGQGWSIWKVVSTESKISHGERHVLARLTEIDVVEARDRKRKGETYLSIWESFKDKSAYTTLIAAITGVTWSCVNNKSEPCRTWSKYMKPCQKFDKQLKTE